MNVNNISLRKLLVEYMSVNIHRSKEHQGNPSPLCTHSIEVERTLREPKFNRGETEEPLYIWGFTGSSLGWTVWKNMMVSNLFKWSCITLTFEVIWGCSLHYNSIAAYPSNPTSLYLQWKNWFYCNIWIIKILTIALRSIYFSFGKREKALWNFLINSVRFNFDGNKNTNKDCLDKNQKV